MLDLNYIECAGVRVPANWTVEQLREALTKRRMRFTTLHEKEIMEVFGNAILLKKGLEQNIDKLKTELERLQGLVKERTRLLACPACGAQWTQQVEPKQPPEKKGR